MVSSDRVPLPIDSVIDWIRHLCLSRQKTLGQLDYIFSTDAYIHHLNQRHLNHDTFTDILTFPGSYDPIEAEIYISADRVEENAKLHGATLEDEFLRVMAHGLLHMFQYDDQSEQEKTIMRSMEEDFIAEYHINYG